MKKSLFVFLFVLFCPVAAGCGMSNDEDQPKENVFTVEEYGLSLKTDEDFRLSEAKNFCGEFLTSSLPVW